MAVNRFPVFDDVLRILSLLFFSKSLTRKIYRADKIEGSILATEQRLKHSIGLSLIILQLIELGRCFGAPGISRLELVIGGPLENQLSLKGNPPYMNEKET